MNYPLKSDLYPRSIADGKKRIIWSSEQALETHSSGQNSNSHVWEGTFAEAKLENKWIKVEVLARDPEFEGRYLVVRADGSSGKFSAETSMLAIWGSHDPISEHEIKKRWEFNELEKLLGEKGFMIEKMEEDGNCLFRAVAK